MIIRNVTLPYKNNYYKRQFMDITARFSSQVNDFIPDANSENTATDVKKELRPTQGTYHSLMKIGAVKSEREQEYIPVGCVPSAH